jgi:alkylation response protein AidB-like acyl-CoA dehydrogenase
MRRKCMNIERLQRWQQPKDDSLREHLDHVHDFGEKHIAPSYKDVEEKGNFPEEIVKKMADLGWFGFSIPEIYGGWGMGALETAYMMRTLAYWGPSPSLIWTAGSSLSASTIRHGGTEEQKHRVLPKIASGEILGCFALTESEAGSDARSLKKKAEKTKNGWNLNGSNRYITNALHASSLTTFARTGPERGNISAFLLESDEPGLKYPGLTVQYKPKWVFKGSDYCELFFDDVELPHDALLGKEGRGFDDVALKTLEGGRINIAAQAIGLAMWVYDDAYDYVHLRKQFGKTLWEQTEVQDHFTKAKTRLDRAWLQVVRVAKASDRGREDIRALSAAVKIKATETSFKVASELAHYFGGVLSDLECSMFQRVINIMMTCDYEGANYALRRLAKKLLNK